MRDARTILQTDSELLSFRQAALATGLSYWEITRLVSENRLPVFRVGSQQIYIRREHLTQLREQGRRDGSF